MLEGKHHASVSLLSKARSSSTKITLGIELDDLLLEEEAEKEEEEEEVGSFASFLTKVCMLEEEDESTSRFTIDLPSLRSAEATAEEETEEEARTGENVAFLSRLVRRSSKASWVEGVAVAVEEEEVAAEIWEEDEVLR